MVSPYLHHFPCKFSKILSRCCILQPTYYSFPQPTYSRAFSCLGDFKYTFIFISWCPWIYIFIHFFPCFSISAEHVGTCLAFVSSSPSSNLHATNLALQLLPKFFCYYLFYYHHFLPTSINYLIHSILFQLF